MAAEDLDWFWAGSTFDENTEWAQILCELCLVPEWFLTCTDSKIMNFYTSECAPFRYI